MKKLCFLVGGSRGLGQALNQAYRAAGFEVIEFSRSGSAEGHVSCDKFSSEVGGHQWSRSRSTEEIGNQITGI